MLEFTGLINQDFPALSGFTYIIKDKKPRLFLFLQKQIINGCKQFLFATPQINRTQADFSLITSRSHFPTLEMDLKGVNPSVFCLSLSTCLAHDANLFNT